MPRLGLATLNHSPLHGLPTQWEAHLDAASLAGYDAIAPDIFWLRAIEAAGVSPEQLAAAMSDRSLACMEIAGIAIGEEKATQAELSEHLRYAEVLGAEFVNARIVSSLDASVTARVRECAEAFGRVGTRLAIEFSRGTQLNSVSECATLLREIDVPGAGVTLDTWHFFLHPQGAEWDALEALPSSLFANVQLSDGVPYEEGAFGEATMNRRRLPGEGGFELARCLELVTTKRGDASALPIVVEVLSEAERGYSLADFARRTANASRMLFPD